MRKLPSLRNGYETYVRDISVVFLLLLPLTISNALSIFAGHALNYAHLKDWSENFFHFSNLLIGIYPIALCIITTYYFAIKNHTSPLVVVPYALVMFLAVSLSNDLVAPQWRLPNNPLVALVSAVIAAICCSSGRLFPLDPLRPDFVRQLYQQVAHLFAFLVLTMLCTKLTGFVMAEGDALHQKISLNPLTFAGGMAYQFVLGLLGAIGINGHNFLFGEKQQLYLDTQHNLAAWLAGDAPLNILSQGFYDAFMSIGGSGNALSLLLCVLFFSRDRRHTILALSAIPLVMFNINELLLFGLPVIFNPTLIVPFILVPLVSFVLVYFTMSMGWVPPAGTIVDWMTPPFMSGYLATQNSWAGVCLQFVVVGVGILIYRPFYRHFACASRINSRAIFRKHEVERSTLKSFIGDVNQAMGRYISKHDVSRRVSRMLSRGEFVMYYQPQVHLNDASHLAFESLVRYRDEQGNIKPSTFIQDFMELGAMYQLDQLVLDLVLADMQKMPLVQGCRIGVNISAETISSAEIVPYIAERLGHYRIPATALEIEITEEAILKDQQQISANIEALQALGVKVAIDDFGAGYASFSHLLKFSFDKVKLDRSLLLNVDQARGQNLYQWLAKISEVTGCAMVAEGIETEQEKAFVASCGIDICQGYYFARPMPLHESFAWSASCMAAHHDISH